MKKIKSALEILSFQEIGGKKSQRFISYKSSDLFLNQSEMETEDQQNSEDYIYI
jgi:hypothetical protein